MDRIYVARRMMINGIIFVSLLFLAGLTLQFVSNQKHEENISETYNKYKKAATMKGTIVKADKPFLGKPNIIVKSDKDNERRKFEINKTDFENNIEGNKAEFKYTTKDGNKFLYDIKQYGEPKNKKEFEKHYHQ